MSLNDPNTVRRGVKPDTPFTIATKLSLRVGDDINLRAGNPWTLLVDFWSSEIGIDDRLTYG